jgi:hypothetical protein
MKNIEKYQFWERDAPGAQRFPRRGLRSRLHNLLQGLLLLDRCGKSWCWTLVYPLQFTQASVSPCSVALAAFALSTSDVLVAAACWLATSTVNLIASTAALVRK